MSKAHRPARRTAVALATTPLLFAPLLVATPAAAVPGGSSQVFINEIHYDNTGTDTGEAIEVAAPAGTDLSGWSLVLYNGNGGASYDTDALSGVVGDGTGTGWGFVTVTYPVNGIQNGAPDGVALVNGSTVVQLLSYEGSFTAVGGPANGMTSTDIGVAETGSEPVGQSLQLTGTGDSAGDFTWAGPATASFGSLNAGQTLQSPGSGDSAPQVTGTTPADGATGVPAGANLTVTFSEPVTLADGSVSLACSGVAQPVTVSGGPTSYTIDPVSDLPTATSCAATVAAAGVTDQDGEDPPDAMAADYTWSFTTAGVCGDRATLISAVQGAGLTSPMVGQTVEVEGVVVADRTATNRLRGFFVQEEDSDTDADPATSEGIFVFGALPAGAGEGSVVRVTGTVAEFGSGGPETQLSGARSQLCETTATMPSAAVIRFPVGAVRDLEASEGMLVTFPQDLVISEYFNFDRFNETVVGVPPYGWDRFFTPTAVVEPGDPAGNLADLYARSRITLDDARTSQNPSPPFFPGTVDTPFTLENRFRGGDTLSGVTGVLSHSFDRYRVHPTTDATHTAVNPRPEEPPGVGGNMKVASFNVLNYFLTLDAGPDVCGPDRDQECRGADTAEEFQRQKAKIVDAIADLDADVVGLMEMENTPGVEPAADLATALNARMGPGTYSYVDTGVVGTDAIRVGMLYKPGKLAATDPFAILDSSVDPRFRDDKNRPALAQTFVQKGTGGKVTVVVNHLKSKGSSCEDVSDPDTGDGQGNCNITRTLAAQALVDWLRTDPTGSGDPDFLIIGDLNSYDREDPIDTLVAGGYTDLVKQFGGEYAYGYVFDGQAGYLDHALSTSTLTPQVTRAVEWHINADEPDILDYDMSFKGTAEDALYEPNQFRSSDHDAVLVGLKLKRDRTG